jgi:hypothetical protein
MSFHHLGITDTTIATSTSTIVHNCLWLLLVLFQSLITTTSPTDRDCLCSVSPTSNKTNADQKKTRFPLLLYSHSWKSPRQGVCAWACACLHVCIFKIGFTTRMHVYCQLLVGIGRHVLCCLYFCGHVSLCFFQRECFRDWNVCCGRESLDKKRRWISHER